MLKQATVARAFNEWMRRYSKEPERFEREWRTVGKFLAAQAAGEEPAYGKRCADYLMRLIDEIAGPVDASPAPPKSG